MSADSLASLTPAARKAAHRLLATGLSEHAYAQAMGIVALEEVLDSRERWQRARHSGDYWASVYGDPEDGQPWSWWLDFGGDVLAAHYERDRR